MDFPAGISQHDGCQGLLAFFLAFELIYVGRYMLVKMQKGRKPFSNTIINGQV